MQIRRLHVAFNVASERLLMKDSHPMHGRCPNKIGRKDKPCTWYIPRKKRVCQFQTRNAAARLATGLLITIISFHYKNV